MGKARLYRYFLVLSLLVSSLYGRAVASSHPVAVKPAKKHSSIYGSEKMPNTELELAHYTFSSPPLTPVQKTLNRTDAFQQNGYRHAGIGGYFISTQRITPPEKEYLLRNYPSHNFW
ncbi:MAG: hypothetical protein U0U70_00560 [Chitinophagaceae bacterium]